MKEYKSIKEVLKKGQLWVNLPVCIAMFGLPIVFFIISPFVFQKDYSAISTFIGIILGFILAWSWWSFSIVKWRIWAFENTKKPDWQKLKEKAIEGKLIWPDGIFFEKTEFRTKKQNQKIENFNTEIENLPSFFENDLSIPKETHYYYNRKKVIEKLVHNVFLIGIGIFVALKGDVIFGVILIGLGLYFIKIKNINNKDIQLSISEIGIDMKFNDFGLVEWGNTKNIILENEHLILEIKNVQIFYEIDFPLKELNIKDYSDFLRRIQTYLYRNKMYKEKYN